MVWFPESCTLCYELSSLLRAHDDDDESLRPARAALRPWVSRFGRNAPSRGPYLLGVSSLGLDIDPMDGQCWQVLNIHIAQMGGSPSCQIAAVDMKGPVAQNVRNKIKENCVMIFSKTYCPYCKMAKKVFDDLGTPYEVYELDKEKDGAAAQDVLDIMTGSRTVPRVFVAGNCIGGGTETRQLYKEGKLIELVEQCRVNS
ncbi:glutaredoxin-2, mitochondrial-like [Palaemon carinicauda]|uniref:glutaredoxin-2, mitochondrial-like n=1 Tax=Palaemon carinicauda TaxID=392227 RepID=UPI0035B5FD0B